MQVVTTWNITHVVGQDDAWHKFDAAFKRRTYWPLTDRAQEYTETKLKACGFNGDFGSPAFSTEVDEKGVNLKCTHTDYRGNARERWELASWGSSDEQAPADQLQRLTASYRARHGYPSPGPRKTTKPPLHSARVDTPPAPAAPRLATREPEVAPQAPAPPTEPLPEPEPPSEPEQTSAVQQKTIDDARDDAWKVLNSAIPADWDDAKIRNCWITVCDNVAAELGTEVADFQIEHWDRVGEIVAVPF